MDKLENVLKAMPCLAGEMVPCCECPYSDREGYGRGNMCKKECAADAVAVMKELEQLEPYVCEGDVKCGNGCEIVGDVRETDFECLKRIFTKAKLVTAFDEYEGMFDNKIIVFLNGNELHLRFDKNTGEVQEENDEIN